MVRDHSSGTNNSLCSSFLSFSLAAVTSVKLVSVLWQGPLFWEVCISKCCMILLMGTVFSRRREIVWVLCRNVNGIDVAFDEAAVWYPETFLYKSPCCHPNHRSVYIYPDAVPPIHTVSYHVATDKVPARNGDKFRSIFRTINRNSRKESMWHAIGRSTLRKRLFH